MIHIRLHCYLQPHPGKSYVPRHFRLQALQLLQTLWTLGVPVARLY